MAEYLVRFAHQCGMGLDPIKETPNRKNRKRWLRYYKGGFWFGGPETATRFRSLEDAEDVIRRFGHLEAMGSIWLGHCEPCEIVTVEQALLDDLEDVA